MTPRKVSQTHRRKHRSQQAEERIPHFIHDDLVRLLGENAPPGRVMADFIWWEGEKRRQAVVVLVGKVQLGTTEYLAGVVRGERFIFLSAQGRIWRVEGRLLPAPAQVPNGAAAKTAAARVWLDSLAQAVEDAFCPAVELEVIDATRKLYRARVMEHVAARVQQAADQGISRTPDDYARACADSWTELDLTPRVPSVTHAVLVSLALALAPDDAAELLQVAGLLAYRMPLLTRQVALLMYGEATRALAAACPAWWHQSYLLDWRMFGSVDAYYRRALARSLVQAKRVGEGIDLAAILGVSTDRARD